VTTGVVAPNGPILVGAMTVGNSLGQVLSVSLPQGASPSRITQGGNLDLVKGIAVFQSIGGCAAASLDGSPASSLALSMIKGTVGLVRATSISSSRLSTTQSPAVPVQSVSPHSSAMASVTAKNGTAHTLLPTSAIDSIFAAWGSDPSQSVVGNGL
jgi:hypothetical protein